MGKIGIRISIVINWSSLIARVQEGLQVAKSGVKVDSFQIAPSKDLAKAKTGTT